MPKAVADPKQVALAAIEGLAIGDCLQFFYDRATPRDHQIADLVETDDELEVEGAIVSEGDEGAFVLAWTYVFFPDGFMEEGDE